MVSEHLFQIHWKIKNTTASINYDHHDLVIIASSTVSKYGTWFWLYHGLKSKY